MVTGINDFSPITNTESQAPQPTPHKVQKGETVYKLAETLAPTLGLSISETAKEILAENPRFDGSKIGGGFSRERPDQDGSWDPDYIKEGEILKLPTKETVAWRNKAPTTDTPPPVEDKKPVDKVEDKKPIDETTKVDDKKKLEKDPLNPDNIKKTNEEKPVEEPEEEPGFFEKIFDVFADIYSNFLFQGALAVMATTASIGGVVTGVAAILGLLYVIGSIVENPDKPPWIGIGSTLLYMAGALVPGIDGFGAFGGLLGTVMGAERPAPKPTGPGKNDGTTAPKRTDPLPDEEYKNTLAKASNVQGVLESHEKFQDWLKALNELATELDIQSKQPPRVDENGQPITNARLNELQELFASTLPNQARDFLAKVTFGVTDTNATETPTAGRFYEVKEGDTWESVLGSISGLESVPEDMQAAIMACNHLLVPEASPEGEKPTLPLVAGQTLYIPTAQQLSKHPPDAWQSPPYLTVEPPAGVTNPAQYVADLRGDLAALMNVLKRANPGDAAGSLALSTQLANVFSKMSPDPNLMEQNKTPDQDIPVEQ